MYLLRSEVEGICHVHPEMEVFVRYCAFLGAGGRTFSNFSLPWVCEFPCLVLGCWFIIKVLVVLVSKRLPSSCAHTSPFGTSEASQALETIGKVYMWQSEIKYEDLIIMGLIITYHLEHLISDSFLFFFPAFEHCSMYVHVLGRGNYLKGKWSWLS